jgi:transposase
MTSTAGGAMLAGVAEAEPTRIWFGRGGCVEQHDDGTYAVFVRGELLGVYAADDVASRDVFIAVVRDQAEREDLARAFRVSPATVGRVVTRFNEGGLRAVADYGRRGGWTVRTPKLMERLEELFGKGFGPRAAHRAVARKASYGTVYAVHQQWLRRRIAGDGQVAQPTAPEPALALVDEAGAVEDAEAPTDAARAETTPAAEEPAREPTLEAVLPSAGAVVQHVGSWLLLGELERLGFHELAGQQRGDVAAAPLRAAIDAAAIALTLGEGCVEGVRRIATPSVDTLLRRQGGISASWVRRVLHDFADVSSETFPGLVATRLLARAGEGEDRVWLYVDNHLRPYTGKHVIRKGWRMQDKRAAPGTTDYYVHDEEGCPLFRLSTTSHDSLCAWLMPVVEFADLALGDEVKPVLVFDRGGAYPHTMAELRDAGAEFVTYERKPYPELGATEFKQSLEIALASRPHRPIRIAYTEAPQKNLRAERGRVRRIALLTEEGDQVNLLAVSELPAATLIRGHLARWGRQENQLKYEVERWGINHLDGRRVEEYPPDALIPNPARRRIDRLLKLSHTAEGEAWRKWGRAAEGDPERQQAKRDIDRAMERQAELMALRAKVPKAAKVSETPLAGRLRRHELGYKNVLDTLRVALANAEADLAVKLAPHLDRPREVKKVLATLFAAPGSVRVSSRAVTVGLMPAASESERDAIRAFLRDVTRRRLSLPGDPDGRRLRWVLR